MRSFRARLAETIAHRDTILCIGLDYDPQLVPASVRAGARDEAAAAAAFNRAIIDATADLVCAYKPNLAFYEALGPRGMAALSETVRHVPDGVLVIADAKRGDIGNTMQRYARALFDVYAFDAATVSPFLGRDALEPFLARPDRGAFVLCRTSNPGAAEIQDLLVGGEPLYEVIARRVESWDIHRNTGLVVGATQPRELARIRDLCPETPILVPGVGAQGGDAATAAAAATNGGASALINVARQVLYASPGPDFATAARGAALRLRDLCNRARTR